MFLPQQRKEHGERRFNARHGSHLDQTRFWSQLDVNVNTILQMAGRDAQNHQHSIDLIDEYEISPILPI